MPYTQHLVRSHLNYLAKTKNIVDEKEKFFTLKHISLGIHMLLSCLMVELIF